MQICAGSNPAPGITAMIKNYIYNFFLIALICLSATVVVVSKNNLSLYKPDSPAAELAYFPSGQIIRGFGPTFTSLIADLAWIQIVQYYGEKVQQHDDLDKLKQILFTLVEIDPNFTYPYTLGAFLLIDNVGDYQGAIQLLDKGIKFYPDRWEFLFTKGFIIWVMGNRISDDLIQQDYYKYSGKLFELAMTKPDCPEYVIKFAAAARQKQNDYLAAAEFWFFFWGYSDFKEQKTIALKNIRLQISRYVVQKIDELKSHQETVTIEHLDIPWELRHLPDGSELRLVDQQPVWTEPDSSVY